MSVVLMLLFLYLLCLVLVSLLFWFLLFLILIGIIISNKNENKKKNNNYFLFFVLIITIISIILSSSSSLSLSLLSLISNFSFWASVRNPKYFISKDFSLLLLSHLSFITRLWLIHAPKTEALTQHLFFWHKLLVITNYPAVITVWGECDNGHGSWILDYWLTVQAITLDNWRFPTQK